MEALGGILKTAHTAFITPRMTAWGRVRVIKAGTFCRTVVWPCTVPLLLHQYIRGREYPRKAANLYCRIRTTKMMMKIKKKFTSRLTFCKIFCCPGVH
ncbi:unnamed protein product [Amoebophrya sp. A120]|nr:unnamed protein product [Amoebophrya sp. A120]|eukprot:GSA120T00016089001.1